MIVRAKHAVPEQVREYLGAVLDRDRSSALSTVDRMLESKKDMAEAFNLLAAAQVEIGEMWAKGIVSVADEHFATNVTLECVDIVSERLSRPRVRRRGLAFLCTVEGEYHLVGLKMFSELLRDQGWETVILGSSFSAESLSRRADALRGRRVDLLCISATMPSCLPLLVDTLEAIRTVPAYSRASIIVGGHAVTSRRWRDALSHGRDGALADFLARGYESALKFAASLNR
ncbi:MAG: cobalamin-dependent protein [Nitrososphaerota archaeon]|nr:cobalamin-dependent protein [Nitrososphaerota archaeon]MDG6951576.1 cobalamin-dependent protein [Nitrososphaerota archaeon]